MSADDLSAEDVAVQWADLLRECARDHGAQFVAWALAEAGMNPTIIRSHAEMWRAEDFQPPAFADKLDEFAERLARLVERVRAGETATLRVAS